MTAPRHAPTGTVTFLFTDIAGSTHLWESSPDAMRPALARHDALLRQAIQEHDGYVFKTVGDAFCAAFATASQALESALAAQLALGREAWQQRWNLPQPLSVRMGLHTGTAEEQGGDYFGPPLNRVARLMAAGHGGQTLLSLASQELTRDQLPLGASLRDLGARRLKDLARPETVFQLLHPGLPADFPPLKSLDNPALPNNLSQQATSFIGRETQITAVKALIQKSRLLTLVGGGGTGKTRLSLQVAADLLDGEGDGVWLVELAALSDPALVPQAVANVLGVREEAGKPIARTREEAGKPIARTLGEWLRHKSLLLVLDNCEHLIAACASLAADLLRSCPGVRLLASSREPLNVPGEQTYRVPPLSLPDPKQPQTVESLSQYEAVRLFIERAQAVQASFSITAVNAPAVAQVCFRLDGIPLAIELAAARVRSLSVEEVNTRLDNRFRLLTGGSRTVLPRQQTLRALIDWSYDLLTEPEKSLLCRLSVFAGGWTLEAAEMVCVGDLVEDFEVLDLLTALADKSLVVAEISGDKTRYGFLETVRQYGDERLGERGETETLRERHLSWCVDLAEASVAELRGPSQGAWLSLLETEHDNLRGGLSWGSASSSGAARGLQLAGALGSFWFVRGHWSEGRACLTASLAREADSEIRAAPSERARALLVLGVLAREQDDWEEAAARSEQALAIFREVGDRSGEARCLGNLGYVKRSVRDWEAARPYCEQALALHREMGNRNGEAVSLNDLGCLNGDQGDQEAQRSCFEQALAIYRELGNRDGEAGALFNLGFLKSSQGDQETASSYYKQALAISQELGSRNREANCLFNLGYVKCIQGDFEAASPYLDQALAIYREIGNRLGESQLLLNMAQMKRDQGDWQAAHSLFAEALLIFRQIENAREICETLAEWAVLALAEGDASRAARLLGAAWAGRASASLLVKPPQERDAQTESDARAALGEEAFAAAWEAGRAMLLDEAAEFALADVL